MTAFIEKAKVKHGEVYDYSKVEYVDSRTPVIITCRVHGEFSQKPANHLFGQGCPKCRAGGRLSNTTFIEKAKAKHGDKYDYTKTEYVHSDKKVIVTCKKHGDFTVVPRNHLGNAKLGCPKCADRGRTNNSALFIEKAKAKHGDKYDYTKVRYVNNKTPVTITCRTHGDFEQTPQGHLASNDPCNKCRLEKVYNHSILSAQKIHNGKYTYVRESFVSVVDKMTIVCPIHGAYEMTINNHVHNGAECKECALAKRGESQWKTLDSFIKDAEKVHGNKYDYSKTVCRGGKKKITITCRTHGDFEQNIYSHLRGAGCPKCSKSGVSKAETEVFNFVRSICPDAVQSDRTTIGPLELDVVVPSRNLAIEFNGLYWHDERTKDKKYHITKRHRVEAAGYRLISIREDVWNERREQVENIIRNALGVASDKVFARKCNIVEVSTSEAKAFMEKHHVQGFRGATVHYGLQHDDTLVAVISLTNWQKKNEWELVRYATACNVPGGLSRLWKHATTVNNIVRAYSYVDRNLFSGSSYANAGFTLSATTVGFRIVNGCTTESREKWNRAPDGMTQTQWYESEGVSRIYDSGQDKLLWVK